MPPFYDRYRRGQPGELSRPQVWWDTYARDPEWTRHGDSRHYDVVYESEPGRVDGWVGYRVENRWPNGLAANIIKVRKLVGLTPEAEAGLWRYLLDLDLAGTVKLMDRKVDDPVRWRLADPQAAAGHRGGRPALGAAARPAGRARRPALRGLGVAGARGHRRPAPPQPGPLPAGGRPRRRHLRAGLGPPDLALDVTDLGAAYLGGASLASLARAERVAELTPGALLRADRMFAASPPPICTTHF